MAPECEKFHKHLAEKIAEKSGEKYSKVISWIRCKLSFLILKAALMCVRGRRSHKTSNESSATTSQTIVALGGGAFRLGNAQRLRTY